jgi:transcriptional regulator GlxA family with amidase domain
MVDDSACERARRIQTHVFAHFRSEIDHGELARLACLSPSALSRFFRRTTGRTNTEFVHEVRVAVAARLLIDTDCNISEIAFAIGFGNVSHFNETFRRLRSVNTEFTSDYSAGTGTWERVISVTRFRHSG